jgi:UDP-N-acetylmuramyl tripeptide synthase
MSRPRDGAAIVAARASVIASRLTGRHATSIPGVVAERIAPGITRRIAADLGAVVLVSGTNGKTSTSRFLAHLLEVAGREVIANRSGANLEQAIASTLLAAASATGRLRRSGAVAVLEVDEATLPAVVRKLPVRAVAMTNVFRDQLDRFGETDHVIRQWTKMLEGLPVETIVAWCADDPQLALLMRGRPGSIPYGLVRPEGTIESAGITTDVSTCPVCSAPLAYAWMAVGHLGDYACTSCDFRRPEPQLLVRASSRGLDRQVLVFSRAGTPGEASVEVGFPGLGNAYNATAALAVATALGVEMTDAAAALAGVSVPFGRFEELEIDGRRVVLSLVKNPASFSEVTRIVAGSTASTILFIFSDNFQDGRDVSWYWDFDPTPMVRERTYVIAGRRATDFQLRLKYELLAASSDPLPGFLGLAATPVEGLSQAVGATPPGGTCFVVSTYTALLALRATLVARGLAPEMPR